MKKATIVYIVNPHTQEVLLAKKTRKVGVGYWFGYGGKIEEGEEADESLCGEVRDEAGGLTVSKEHLERVGIMDFYNGPDVPFGEPTFRVLCYRTETWEGTPSTTEEMADPTWFSISALNDLDRTGELKPGDLPFVLRIIANEPFQGWTRFSKDEKEVLGQEVISCDQKDLIL